MNRFSLLAALLLAVSAALHADDWSVRPINGVPRLTRNGEAESNFIFSAARITKGDPVETESVAAEVKLARKHGVRVYSVSFLPLWGDEAQRKAAADFADHICGEILKSDPDAFFMPRVQFQEPPFAEADMREKNLSADGSRDQVAIASARYRREAAGALRDFIRYMERKYGDHMMGYHVAAGHHGEFQYCNFARRGNLFGYDDATGAAFRNFLKEKYRNDLTALCRAWKKNHLTFENAPVPPPTLRSGREGEVFHDPHTEQASIDFNAFLNRDMADFALELARVVREECGKTRIVSVFYGYLFECMPQSNGPSQSGHFALARLLRSPDIDVLCGPYSYSNLARVPGGPQFTHTVGESITAAGKIWFNEDDTATHISMRQRMPEDGSHRAAFDRTLEETRLLLRRNFLFNLARNYGVWWYDHQSRGMWNDPALWEEKAFADRIEAAVLDDPEPSRPDVTLVFDEKNADFIVSANEPRYTLEGGVSAMRDRVSRSGCASGVRLLDDIVSGKAGYSKLDIHCNAVALTGEERRALRDRAGKIPTVWMWAPGYIDLDRNKFSLKTIEETTGFKVRPVQPATWTVWARPEGFDFNLPDHYGWGQTLRPVFAPVPEKGDLVLAYWRDSYGTPAIVLRPGRDGRPFSVFCGAVDLPAATIRAFARKAGAHVYCSRNAGIHKGRDFVAVTAGEGGLYDLNVGGAEEWFDAYTGRPIGRGPQLKLNLKPAETFTACRKILLNKIHTGGNAR